MVTLGQLLEIADAIEAMDWEAFDGVLAGRLGTLDSSAPVPRDIMEDMAQVFPSGPVRVAMAELLLTLEAYDQPSRP